MTLTAVHPPFLKYTVRTGNDNFPPFLAISNRLGSVLTGKMLQKYKLMFRHGCPFYINDFYFERWLKLTVKAVYTNQRLFRRTWVQIYYRIKQVKLEFNAGSDVLTSTIPSDSIWLTLIDNYTLLCMPVHLWGVFTWSHQNLCTYQCQAGERETGHKAGIWHFPKNCCQVPYPQAKCEAKYNWNSPPREMNLWSRGTSKNSNIPTPGTAR